MLMGSSVAFVYSVEQNLASLVNEKLHCFDPCCVYIAFETQYRIAEVLVRGQCDNYNSIFQIITFLIQDICWRFQYCPRMNFLHYKHCTNLMVVTFFAFPTVLCNIANSLVHTWWLLLLLDGLCGSYVWMRAFCMWHEDKLTWDRSKAVKKRSESLTFLCLHHMTIECMCANLWSRCQHCYYSRLLSSS